MTSKDLDRVYHELAERDRLDRHRHFSSSLLRLWDGDMATALEVRALEFHEGEDPCWSVGGGASRFPYASPEGHFLWDLIHPDEDVHLTVELVDPDDPARGWESRVAFKAVAVDLVEEEDGSEWVEVEWQTILLHWDQMILMALPMLPPQVQPLKYWPAIGPIRSSFLLAWQLALAVTYAPLWRFVDDWASPAAYAEAVDPRRWPMVVSPLNVMRDGTKPQISVFRFDMALPAMVDALRDADCIPVARQWLPGDPQPFPDHVVLVRPTVVIDIEHHTVVPGMTGTLLDGFINLAVQIGDDLVTQVVHPVLDPYDQRPLPSQHPIGDRLGLAPAKPWPGYRRGEYSGIIGGRISRKKSMGTVFWTGGRSPEWVNQAITLAITTALDYLGFAMAIPGLGNLYQGQFDNTLLAFAKVEDRRRARRAGRFARRHVWCSEGGTGFGMATAIALRQGWFDTRPRLVRTVEVVDGFPHRIYRDVRKGEQCWFEMPDGSIYVDRVTNIKHRLDRETELRFALVIGDDTGDEDVIAQLWAQANHIRDVARKIFLEK
ncbi:MAG: hypothetical protein QM809_11520 [Gordonia sp. (in: high G+C Gram-positive bacteria)]|uniref:Gp37-like protein n=1 Tax=Gordonia sp. (in: high G+C Gram-positive bacteria) TaxID=84139 RepID=UPI0039E38CDA